jgi:dTMP kinase
MPQLKQGLLISIEGIDGSGKSTLTKNLYATFSQNDYDVIVTREPGGTPLGLKIRELIQNNSISRCSKAEYLLFAADRAQHFEKIVIPGLSLNKIVLSDRLSDSSITYQGYGNGLSIKHVEEINQWTMNNIISHLTIYIRIPITIALERIAQRNSELSLFEKKEFLEKVVTGFEALYKNRSDVLIVDGTQPQTTLTENIFTLIKQWILQKNFLLNNQ